MTKSKNTKKNIGISPERLAQLRRKTLIESTGSSLRLSGSKVTNEQVEQIMMLSKLSEQKKAH
jgi:hypothetical protein